MFQCRIANLNSRLFTLFLLMLWCNTGLFSINYDETGLVSRLVTFPMYPGDEGVYRCEISSYLPEHTDWCSMQVDVIGERESERERDIDRKLNKQKNGSSKYLQSERQ